MNEFQRMKIWPLVTQYLGVSPTVSGRERDKIEKFITEASEILVNSEWLSELDDIIDDADGFCADLETELPEDCDDAISSVRGLCNDLSKAKKLIRSKF